MKFAEPVLKVIQQIIAAGGKVYIVGGAVRESLLGTNPQEFDIATDIPANVLKKLFPDAKLISPSAYLVFRFSRSGYKFEVARMRRDFNYSGRHSRVVFTSKLKEDLQRRDFTVNALAYDPKGNEIIDLFNGKKDIENRVIRSIGNATVKFQEDKLRMLRAIRFAARLNFRLADDVECAIKSLSSEILTLSRELVRREISKMLEDKSAPRALFLLHKTALFREIFSVEAGRETLIFIIRSLNYLVRTNANLILKLATILYWGNKGPDNVYLPFSKREKKLLNYLLDAVEPFENFLDGKEVIEVEPIFTGLTQIIGLILTIDRGIGIEHRSMA